MTIEELLGLSQEGWRDIEKMSDEELEVYLKDVTNLEPKSIFKDELDTKMVGQLCGESRKISTRKKKVVKDKTEDSFDVYENPIKQKKKLTTKEKSERLDNEFNELMKGLE